MIAELTEVKKEVHSQRETSQRMAEDLDKATTVINDLQLQVASLTSRLDNIVHKIMTGDEESNNSQVSCMHACIITINPTPSCSSHTGCW